MVDGRPPILYPATGGRSSSIYHGRVRPGASFSEQSLNTHNRDIDNGIWPIDLWSLTARATDLQSTLLASSGIPIGST